MYLCCACLCLLYINVAVAWFVYLELGIVLSCVAVKDVTSIGLPTNQQALLSGGATP